MSTYVTLGNWTNQGVHEVKNGPKRLDEKVGLDAPREKSYSPRIVGILVQHAFNPRGLQSLHQGRRTPAISKGQKLHEEPAIGGLSLTVAGATLLSNVQCLNHGGILPSKKFLACRFACSRESPVGNKKGTP